MPERDLVFFSYRHGTDGERWLDALHGMLEPYVLGQHLVAWSDRDIRTGEQWHGRIQSAIDRTRVAVLLVNQRFFGSAYIREHELPRLVADARAGYLVPVVVVVGAVDLALMAEYGLSAFQGARPPDQPMNGLRGGNLDKALVSVAMRVREAYGAAVGHGDLVSGALLLPDSRRVLSWSHDGTLRVWSFEGATKSCMLARHEDAVSGALLLSDGQRALSWSRDRTLRLWDLDRMQEIARYDADAVVTAVAVTPTRPWRIFLGDALGYVQILTLRDRPALAAVRAFP